MMAVTSKCNKTHPFNECDPKTDYCAYLHVSQIIKSGILHTDACIADMGIFIVYSEI